MLIAHAIPWTYHVCQEFLFIVINIIPHRIKRFLFRQIASIGITVCNSFIISSYHLRYTGPTSLSLSTSWYSKFFFFSFNPAWTCVTKDKNGHNVQQGIHQVQWPFLLRMVGQRAADKTKPRRQASVCK